MASDKVSMDALHSQASVQFARMMKTAYLNYAVETIKERALPDVRDGLKPVQRRILYTMHEMGLNANAKYRKSARVVGDAMGKYHPHGDSSIYEAMVRMAQDFTMRAPLVDGQGNFGSIDGDSAAAMRYTEARMTPLTQELLADIEADTVVWQDNFDNTLREPTYLPARFPNLLVNGSEGIAVGMACKTPPHNLGEVCNAMIFLAENWKRRNKVTVAELMEHIKGPDFPTGGILYQQRDENGTAVDMVAQAFETGHGKITMQGVISGEDGSARPVSNLEDARRLIITEIPYGLNKSTLLTQIADGVRNEKIKGISDLRDESDYEGMRIVVTITRGYRAPQVLEQLLSRTSLKLTYGIITLALVDGEPEYLPLRRLLTLFLEHRLDVITRRSRHELKQREARLHVVEGLLKALDAIDEVVDIIRRSQSADTARKNLMSKLDLSEVQATAILNTQLRRLAALERKQLQNERKSLRQRIKELKALLASEQKQLQVIIDETSELKEQYATPRKTAILQLEGQNGLVTKEDLLRPDGKQVITATTGGNLLRADGKGFSWRQSAGLSKRAVDAPLFHLRTQPEDMVILLSSKGRAWLGPVYRIPEKTSTVDFGLDKDEAIINAVVMPESGFLTIATSHGKVKRTQVEDLSNSQGHWGKIVGGLDKHDEVVVATISTEAVHVILFGSHGKAIQFKADEVNPQASNTATGVAAMKLGKNDRIVAGAIVSTDPSDQYALVISERGYTKRVALSEFPVQGRGGQGVQALKLGSDTGKVVAATVGGLKDSAAIMSGRGRRFLLPVIDLPEKNRASKGEQLVDFGADDTIQRVIAL